MVDKSHRSFIAGQLTDKEDKKEMQQTGRAGNSQHKKEKKTTKRASKLERFYASKSHRKQQLKENTHKKTPSRSDMAVHKQNATPAQNNHVEHEQCSSKGHRDKAVKPYTAQLPLFKISCYMTLEGAWGHILGQGGGPGLRTRHVSEPLHVHASPPWAEPGRAAKHG